MPEDRSNLNTEVVGVKILNKKILIEEIKFTYANLKSKNIYSFRSLMT